MPSSRAPSNSTESFASKSLACVHSDGPLTLRLSRSLKRLSVDGSSSPKGHEVKEVVRTAKSLSCH